jgi:hypothetical protein
MPASAVQAPAACRGGSHPRRNGSITGADTVEGAGARETAGDSLAASGSGTAIFITFT